MKNVIIIESSLSPKPGAKGSVGDGSCIVIDPLAPPGDQVRFLHMLLGPGYCYFSITHYVDDLGNHAGLSSTGLKLGQHPGAKKLYKKYKLEYPHRSISPGQSYAISSEAYSIARELPPSDIPKRYHSVIKKFIRNILLRYRNSPGYKQEFFATSQSGKHFLTFPKSVAWGV